jgi:uncharacterized protein (DUF2336 family)
MPEQQQPMPHKTSRLKDLVDLAKERSSDKRRELLRNVTDVFLEAAPNYSPAERDHFGAIMSNVAREMEVAIRQQLAAKLSASEHAPANLIRQLANDEDISVAKDVLLNSPLLKDSDLIAIARSQVQEKLALIARRPQVSEAVSDAIVENGDDAVVETLVGNGGAKLNRETFERVVERSEASTGIQASLVGRADLPPDLLQEMYSFVAAELRAKVAEKLDSLPPELLDEAFNETSKTFSAEMRALKDADRKAMVYVAEMARRNQLNESLLHQLIRTGKEPEFVHAFAKLTDVRVRTVQRMVKARNTDAVAIICKSAGLDRSTFSAIVCLFEGTPEAAGRTPHPLLHLYDAVTADSAQRAMRFWRVRAEVEETAAAAQRSELRKAAG